MIEEGWFVGHGGWRVFHRWIVPAHPVGVVMLQHGYSEHSGPYTHVMEALADRGLAVVAQDHRGHGRTARVLGDLEDVEHILTDLGVLHRRALELAPGVPLLALGHSMGALLTLRYLRRHGDGFAGAVVNGSALQVPRNIPRGAKLAARLMGRAWPTLPIQPFFDPTRACRDPAVQARMRTDPLQYRGRIRARTGAQIMRAIPQTLADLPKLRVPLLITHGGDDRTVPVDASHIVWHGVVHRDKTLHVFHGLRHEVHQEPEREAVIGTWADWMVQRCSSVPRASGERRSG